MYPIGFALKLAISFYHLPVFIYDVGYEKNEDIGVDERVITATRTIQAAIDPSRSKDMERIFGGSIGDGDIGIYCDTDTLYIDDAYDDGGTRLQSFIEYQGNKYRVAQNADWTPQVDIRVYLAQRYHDQDGLFDSEESS